MVDQTEHAQARFEKIVSFLIASVTVLAALIATLQVNASTRSQEANRTAQSLSIAATEKQIGGLLEFNAQYNGAVLLWQEADLRAYAAGQDGDTHLQQRYEKLRDQMLEISPLLQPPYYGEEAIWPDTFMYEANQYLVESTRLGEETTAQSKIGRDWSDIANAYVVQLMLLAVALSMFGLATTVRNFMRWAFIILGILITLFNTGWAGYLLISTPPPLNHTAIDAFAEGTGYAYQGLYDDAIAAFTQAIEADPDYANAYYERGSAHINQSNYALATEDYERAKLAGKDDESVNWNLAWAYYMLGDFDKARVINETIIASRPEFIGITSNQALIYLAEGNYDKAGQMYEAMLAEAAREIDLAYQNGTEPPASLFYYLDAATLDLQSLIDKLNGVEKSWTQAPDPAVVAADHAEIEAFAADLIVKIKEAATSLEYDRVLPTSDVAVEVEPLRFGNYLYDDNYEITGFEDITYFPQFTTDLTALIDYTGLSAGEHTLVWKVYYDGYEDHAFRTRWIEGLEESGSYELTLGFAYTNVFYLLPGEYFVEVYIDSRLVQTGTFYVEEFE